MAGLIAQGAAPERLFEQLKLQNFSARNFLNEADIHSLGFPVLGEISYTSNLEAIALLVLSGTFIGFIPEQYARKYVDQGALMAVMPDQIARVSRLMLAHRKGEDSSRELIARALQFILAA